MKKIKTVSFIGSGNVATNLSKSLFFSGLNIDLVYSNTFNNAKKLADQVNSVPINDLSDIVFKSDLIVIALKDDIIKQVLDKAQLNNCLIVHTSGSFNTDNLKEYSTNYGCFYPFQTFRKELETELSETHFFVEANVKEEENRIFNLAKLFSKHVVKMNSYDRKSLHIAGVGLNNFTHFILSITKEYCESNNLKTEYMTNLLTQTVNNAFYVKEALNLQTGPARRGDVKVVKEHIDRLDNSPKFQKIYKTISQLILDEFHEDQFKL